MKNQTLRGRVITVFGSIGKFASTIGWSRRKASYIINGQQEATAKDSNHRPLFIFSYTL